MPACEYCSEHFPKGGAHATHERNCEARPPADEKSDEDDPTDDEIQEAGNGVNMTEEDLEDLVTSVETHAYEQGREDAQQNNDSAEVESTTEDTDTGDTETSVMCPNCDDVMLDGGELVDELEEMDGAESFVAANANADVAYACREFKGCGTYFTPDWEARTFDRPSEGGGWFTLVMVGVGALVALVLGALSSDDKNSNPGPRTY